MEIKGTAGSDILKSETGADTMIGGQGDDIYYVSDLGDKVIEKNGEGYDTIVSKFSYTLPENVEHLELIGNENINGTGNNLKNSLWGNSANNVLDGGTGGDSMFGGQGDDTYYVDNSWDIVTESAGQGNDTVISSINYSLDDAYIPSVKYTLHSNVENLVLSGKGNLTATGSKEDNILVGNSGNNILDGKEGNDLVVGGEGNDTLIGGAGDDTLTGGSGKDKYMIGIGSGHDVITADASNTEDTLVLSDVKTLDDFKALSSTQNGDDLILNLNANDSVTVKGWYKEGAMGSIQLGNGQVFGYRPGTEGNDPLTGSKGNDIIMGGAGDDIINGDAGRDAINAGAGNDTIIYDAADAMIDGGEGNDTLDASSSKGAVNLDMTRKNNNFSNIENLTGGAGNDTLIGDSNANTLIGGAGNDTLKGGAGDDRLLGGMGSDTYVFAEGTGSDTIAKDSYNKLDTIDISAFKQPELDFSVQGQNLQIQLGATDKLTLEGYFDDNDSKVGQIKAKINGKLMTMGFQSGNNDNNELNGGAGADFIDGLAGDDTIYGLAGDDWLGGGEGNDIIYGGDGNDNIWDDAGTNKMYGGKGNDIISADRGVANNELYGEEGNDTLEAWAIGNTILDGGAGNDTLYLSGNGTMKGGAGNDTYVIGGLWNGTGAGGNIVIDNSVDKGDNGNDTLKLVDDLPDPDRSSDQRFKGKKDDFTYTLNGSDLVMTLKSDNSTITIKNWTTNKIETLVFADGTVTGKQLEAAYFPQAPVTPPTPSGSTITYDIGSSTNLVIKSDTSNSTKTLEFVANNQADWSWINNADMNTIVINDSNNQPKDLLLQLDSNHSIKLENYFSSDARNRISNISFSLPMLNLKVSYSLQLGQGTDGNEIIICKDDGALVNGKGGNDVIFGSEKDDNIIGMAGNDILFGNEGKDILNGGDGNDILYNSTGDDSLTGGAGSDTYVMDLGNGYNWGNGYFGHNTIVSDATNYQDTVKINLDWTGRFVNDANGGHYEDVKALDRIVATYNQDGGLVLAVSKDNYQQPDSNLTFLTIDGWSKGAGYQPTFNIDEQNYVFKDGAFQLKNDASLPINSKTTIPTSGKDTYEYTVGQGSLTVKKDAGNNQDTLKVNIDPQQLLTMTDFEPEEMQSGNDLVLSLNDSNKIVLQGWFEDPKYQVHNIELAVPGNNTFGINLDLKMSILTDTPGNMNVTGTSASEFIMVGEGDHILHGAGGNDIISGGGGNVDIIYGDDGDDILYGNSGNDQLYGGAGYDLLAGGSGQDTLAGGAGNDVYMIGGDIQYDYQPWNLNSDNHDQSNMDTIISDTDNHNDKVFLETSFDKDKLALTMKGNDLLISKHNEGSYYDYNTNSMQNKSWDTDILTIKDFGLGAGYQPTFKFMSDNSIHTIDLANGPRWK
jgi:Ca2+-binding RTX toxin-like protein